MLRSCNQLAILLSRTYLNNTDMMRCGPESNDRKARGDRIANPKQRRATLRARVFGRNPAGRGDFKPFRRCSPLIWNNQTERLAPRTVIKIAAVARAHIVEIGSALTWQILR
jgi:hypothetical protein